MLAFLNPSAKPLGMFWKLWDTDVGDARSSNTKKRTQHLRKLGSGLRSAATRTLGSLGALRSPGTQGGPARSTGVSEGFLVRFVGVAAGFCRVCLRFGGFSRLM